MGMQAHLRLAYQQLGVHVTEKSIEVKLLCMEIQLYNARPKLCIQKYCPFIVQVKTDFLRELFVQRMMLQIQTPLMQSSETQKYRVLHLFCLIIVSSGLLYQCRHNKQRRRNKKTGVSNVQSWSTKNTVNHLQHLYFFKMLYSVIVPYFPFYFLLHNFRSYNLNFSFSKIRIPL